jgi:hypothetical protein
LGIDVAAEETESGDEEWTLMMGMGWDSGFPMEGRCFGRGSSRDEKRWI